MLRRISVGFNYKNITITVYNLNIGKHNLPILSIIALSFQQGHRIYKFQQPASVAQLDAPSDWRPGGRGFNPRRGRQHSFVEIDHEIFSTVILSLPLIQEGQLSVYGERMCTILVNSLEDYAYPVNVWLGKLTALDMTPLGWLGRKTSAQTNFNKVILNCWCAWNSWMELQIVISSDLIRICIVFQILSVAVL